MSIIDDDHAGPVIAFIGVLVILIALPMTAVYLEHRDREDVKQDIKKAGNCPIRATTPCGEDVCEYTARVPCDELEKLIKSAKEKEGDSE